MEDVDETSKMKRALLLFSLVVLLCARSHAECAYFRVSTDLLKCGPADAKALKAADPYQPPAPDLPELQEQAEQPMIQVTCDCSYSLMGADQRCDQDQEFERTSIVGVEKPAEACRRGRSLCKDVCPPRLP